MPKKGKCWKQSDLQLDSSEWMANKETDNSTRYPTTFIESAGTSTKLALSVVQKYGCVPGHMLPMDGPLSQLKANVFFSIAAQFRITAYYNLGREPGNGRTWLVKAGPILTRLDVDKNWKNATSTNGQLTQYAAKKTYGAHAVCLSGILKIPSLCAIAGEQKGVIRDSHIVVGNTVQKLSPRRMVLCFEVLCLSTQKIRVE
ncbi:MAG: hypothetical protein CSA33_00375 [Desulfobulbus propionicus]|nr:MAG: hypothetical protein CSA33_00375 [Desulfobulbus propionicus]